MVEVAIMNVVKMARMFDGSMAAALAMLVTAVGMGAGGAHKICWFVNTKIKEFFWRRRLANKPMLGPSRECQQLPEARNSNAERLAFPSGRTFVSFVALSCN
jgi:hypothetical protein